jgi:ABC-type phosphate/phosphonate transport system permease subunit
MNEWHNESKDEINKKILTLVVMLALGTCLAILFALAAAHISYVFG